MRLPMPDPDDRRKADRVGADLRVEVYDKDGRKIEGRVRDISMTGLGVEAEEGISIGDKEIKIKLFLPGGDEIDFEASVVWQKRGEGVELFGITGLKIGEEDRRKFVEFLMDRLWSMFFTLYMSEE